MPADRAPDTQRTAEALGRLGRSLDGSVTRGEELASRERFLVALSDRSRRGRWVGLGLVAAAAATVLVVLLSGGVRPAAVAYDVSGPASASGEWTTVPTGRGPVAFRFSEGTEMDLGPGSRGKVAEVTDRGARVVLGEGKLHARVVHHDEARWAVVAGPYEVLVTGTAFDVSWSAAETRLELSLHDGSVTVRGPALESGMRVAAGQRLVADPALGRAELTSLLEPRGEAETEPTSAADEAAVDAPAPDPSASAAPERIEVPHGPSWSELVAKGSFSVVVAAADARGLDRTLSTAPLRDLVALSDAARYAGKAGLARRGLAAQRKRFAGSKEARAAAFVLGRMAHDAGALAKAVTWYDTYLAESPGGSFAAEASGRRVVALVGMGRAVEAKRAAGAYLERFPKGAHAAYAKDVIGQP